MRNRSYLAIVPCVLAVAWLAGCGGSSYGGGGSPTTVAVSPKNAAVVVTTQVQMFTATVTGGKSTVVGWSVDGTPGGSAAVGTISVAGLYTPPPTAGTHTILAISVADPTKRDTATVSVTDLSGVTTYHNDLARDGANTQEFALTPATVTSATFGKRFACTVDGAAYTQPLWVPALNINGAVRNVIFVATQHDSVYAFDADTSPCVMLWQAQLLLASHGGTAGETPVPWMDVGNHFGDIQPEIGVTGTPVIDPATSTLYVVSKSENLAGTFFQRLHALDLATGAEKFSGPTAITATVPGTGDGSVGGNLTFNPQTAHQRSGLALSNGIVYIAWASHEDKDPYHGWIIGYDAATLAPAKVLNVSPDGSRSGIWMAGGAPAVDSAGDLYATTGNGTFDAIGDYGDTVLKIGSSGALTVTGWFTPYNQVFLDNQDLDLGSSGVVILPDQPTTPSHLLVTSGKQGQVYLLDRDNLGGYCNGCPSDSNAVQSFGAFQDLGYYWGTPAFWQNRLYIGGTQEPPGPGEALRVFDFTPPTHSFATTPSSQSSTVFAYTGTIPSVSSQGSSGGIVWSPDISAYGSPAPRQGPAILHAYDATNLGTELWNSSQAAGNRDQAGNAVKFSVPTIANGKVYLGTRSEIEVYGLLP